MSFASMERSVAAARPGWRHRVLHFLVVAGPGLIVMVADNDAGAVSTYTQAGAQYGTSLLWVLLLLLPVTYFVQEMVARLGIATGQGHAAMIYQRFGKWWGRFSLVDLLLLNFLTLVTEFAAIALAARHLGLTPSVVVPLAAVGLILLVGTGSYRRWERMTLLLCGLNLAWFGLAALVRPDWGSAAMDSVLPNVPPGGVSGDFVFLVIAMVGTTIAPWQLFFQQSCVADKRLRFADLKLARLDTLVGAVAVVAFAGCMLLVGDAMHRNGLSYQDPAQMAGALTPLIGIVGSKLILLLMCNAALLGATAISLSSAWAWGEVMGWRNTLEARISQAPHFYAAYALCVAAAAGLVLVPGAPLQVIILGVQVLAGVMLPSAIVFLQLLLNDRAMLGERFANRRWNNWVNWTVIAALFALSLVLAAQVIAPTLFSAAI
ncbi:MAG TPA: Nramp family divalent metal transporter [Acetobacteraceae bacterium]|jgi:Mn2+/Fe2+ NRAMP family transporter|nr:Nramp family divalent metal transporter [Acetobacteraceae bacterium]